MTTERRARVPRGGKLRIGDDWNAIRIIALSQGNPLKAVAEFVENSIDAGARNITITRGREKREQYLTITDDGSGVPRDKDGHPDFRYVATHICDSIKRRLKEEGAEGLQGEFGIGLLSFWTVGRRLSMTCAGDDGRAHTMIMEKGDPGYKLKRRKTLLPHSGTQLKITPLLPGLKQLGGEKLQWYLASELRERIRQAGVSIRIVDRVSRKEFKVEPRQYSGRLLHGLPAVNTPFGEVYAELYLSEPDETNAVGLYRNGTRVLAELTELEGFQRPPWTERVLQGILDAPFLHLTPATRTGVVHDDRLAVLAEGLGPLEEHLNKLIEEQRRAERERASRNMLKAIHRAFREALTALPVEEYDWFDVRKPAPSTGVESLAMDEAAAGLPAPGQNAPPEFGQSPQKEFFEYAGPLHQVRISPASSVLGVGRSRTFRALCRDRRGRSVEEGLRFRWEILEGGGRLENADGEIVTCHAPPEPGLLKLRVTVVQGEIECQAEALVTVTDSLVPEGHGASGKKQSGLPGYTFERAPGKLWRSRFDGERNIIVINNGHRDFVFASRTRALKLRYIARLYAKELVLKNFPGTPSDQLLERLIELSLYTEENLKS